MSVLLYDNDLIVESRSPLLLLDPGDAMSRVIYQLVL